MVIVKMLFRQLQVDYITDTSGIFVGDNLQIDWQASSLENDGYGSITGDNNTHKAGRNLVITIKDPDSG